MLTKIKNIPLLFILAGFAILGWAYVTMDQFTAQNRVSVETTFIDESTGEITILPADEPIPEATPETEPKETPKPQPVLEAEDPEGPGTILSDEILEDLNLESRPNEENIYYTSAVPNDAIYPQWYTTIIDAPQAWDIATGSSDTLVAVIDTGYALEHEDLNAAWFTNSGEQGLTTIGDVCWAGLAEDKQTNDCDDDANGYIDDWRGWDFSNADNNPQAGDNYAPGSTHGTKSAGLIGGRGDNTLGVASVNWGTQILPLQSLYDQGYGYSSDIAAAVHYAVEMGADVINMSLGGPSPSTATRAAIQYALENNVVVVAAAGNCGIEGDPDCVGTPPGGMEYPGRFPETIAVGATNISDTRANFSSYGSELDVVAPGSGSIRTPTWSTDNGTSLYSSSSYGTSFSAPIVAGAVALVKTIYPDVTQAELLTLLNTSSDKVAAMNGNNKTDEYGFGRLNVEKLLLETAEYQKQLQKTDGQLSQQNASLDPLVTTNIGHSTKTGIVNSSTVITYCVTEPLTTCELELNKVGSSEVFNFPARLANNQGIVEFEWFKSFVSSGSWDATVTSNAKTSTKERLIVL